MAYEYDYVDLDNVPAYWSWFVPGYVWDEIQELQRPDQNGTLNRDGVYLTNLIMNGNAPADWDDIQEDMLVEIYDIRAGIDGEAVNYCLHEGVLWNEMDLQILMAQEAGY